MKIVNKKNKKKPLYYEIQKQVPIIIPIKDEPIDLFNERLKDFAKEFKNDGRFFLVFIDDSKDYFKYIFVLKTIFRKYIEYDNNIYYYFQSGNIIFIHRKIGKGKPSAINFVVSLLNGILDFEYFAIYDVEWEIKKDHIIKGISEILQDKKLAFVQFKLKSKKIKHSLIEFADLFYDYILLGKELSKEPILFTGTCAILSKDIFLVLGGFPNHITEDAAYTLKVYLNGYRGKYLYNVVVEGQILPEDFNSAIKTFVRWVYGGLDLGIKNWSLILFSKKLKLKEKISLLDYLTYNLYSFAFNFLLILLGFLTIILPTEPIDIFLLHSLVTLPIYNLFTSLMVSITIYQKKRRKSLYNAMRLYVFGWFISIVYAKIFLRALFGRKLTRTVTKKKGKSKVMKDLTLLALITSLSVGFRSYLFLLSGAILAGLINGITVYSSMYFVYLQLKSLISSGRSLHKSEDPMIITRELIYAPEIKIFSS